MQARLVAPRIPEQGEIDLAEFHRQEGRKYLVAYTLLSWVTVAVNALLGEAVGILQWPEQNLVIVPMAAATTLAAIFVNRGRVQSSAGDSDRRMDLVLRTVAVGVVRLKQEQRH